jgi:hypothetical protein
MAYRGVLGFGHTKPYADKVYGRKPAERFGCLPDNLTRPRPLRRCDDPSHLRRREPDLLVRRVG